MTILQVQVQDNDNLWRIQKLYSFDEAAQLSGVSANTVRNWTLQYGEDERVISPLFDPWLKVSFLQLIEVVVAARFQKATHKSFEAVRDAYRNTRKLLYLDFPFAHSQLDVLGGHVMAYLRGQIAMQVVDKSKQRMIPSLVWETIHQLDYEEDLAARWYPVGKSVPIVVDPRVSAGLPIVLGRGITVQRVHERFMVGQTVEFIAKDFDLAKHVVEEVLRYAIKVGV